MHTLNVDFIDNDSENYEKQNIINICQYCYEINRLTILFLLKFKKLPRINDIDKNGVEPKEIININNYLVLYKTPNVKNLESLKAILTNEYDYSFFNFDKSIIFSEAKQMQEGIDINTLF